jgi:hypothetical protein
VGALRFLERADGRERLFFLKPSRQNITPQNQTKTKTNQKPTGHVCVQHGAAVVVDPRVSQLVGVALLGQGHERLHAHRAGLGVVVCAAALVALLPFLFFFPRSCFCFLGCFAFPG